MLLRYDFRDLDDLFDNLGYRHVHNLLYCALLDTLLWNNLCEFNNFLDNLRHRNVEHLLYGALLDALLRNNLGNFDNFLDNLRHRNVNHLLYRPLLDALLRNDLCKFHDLFHNLRYRHVNDLLDSTLLHALLGNNLGHLNDFLDNLGHGNVDNLFDDLLDHLGHRNINNLLDRALLNTLLRNDLRDLYSLFNDLLDRPLNFLHNFLDPLNSLDLRDLLDLHHFLNRWDLDNVLADAACDDLLLVHRVHYCGTHDLGRRPTDVDRCTSLACRSCGWGKFSESACSGACGNGRRHSHLRRAPHNGSTACRPIGCTDHAATIADTRPYRTACCSVSCTAR